jgi:hypothetical protein
MPVATPTASTENPMRDKQRKNQNRGLKSFIYLYKKDY